MGLIRRAAAAIRHGLAEPMTAGLALDDLDTTVHRADLIQSKRFVRRIYEEWYRLIAETLPPIEGPVVEIGSGGGFLRRAVPGVFCSDVLLVPTVHLVLDAAAGLPFTDASLRAIVMTNAFHHIPDARRFLGDVVRCLKPGGVLAMIEPWVTPWSRFVYTNFHHEPFEPTSPSWELDPGRPLSAANGALPWIVFERDRQLFDRQFPALHIVSLDPLMPLRYLLSGGVSIRSAVPAWSFPFWRQVDELLLRTTSRSAMFARVVVRRN